MEREILIDNLKIHYKIAGSGPAILILHGWGSSSEKWQEIEKILSQKGFKVLIPDLPGFGKSDKPTFAWNLDNYCHFVNRLVAFLNIKKFYLLGHSFGGALALKYSLKFPEKINKLFLVAPACFRKKGFREKIFYLSAKILKIFSFLPGYPFFKKAFYKFIVRKSDYPYTEEIMRDIYLNIIKEDLSDVLTLLKVSTLIIWGEKDDVVPLKNAYLIKKRIPNSHLVIIPEGDHYLEQKFSKKLAETIINLC